MASRQGAAPFPRRRGAVLLGAALACVVAGAVLAGAGSHMLRASMREALENSPSPPAAAAFYAERDYRPIWVEATGLWPFWVDTRIAKGARERAAQLVAADEQRGGNAPDRRRVIAALKGGDLGRPGQAAQVEVALTSMLVARAESVAQARHRELAFVDPAFAAPAPVADFLQWATFAPSAVRDIRTVNPVYDDLARGLVAYRRQWSRLPKIEIAAGPPLQKGDRDVRVRMLRARLGLPAGDVFDAPLADVVMRFQSAHDIPASSVVDDRTRAALNLGAAHFERLIEANLQRAQALPPPVTKRFILVNPAAGRLWLYEDGHVVDTMKVIVGARRDQTPNMVGLIRYMVYNPYWEIPLDIAQESVAAHAARQGPGYVEAKGIEVLSDWSDTASRMSPRDVDWAAVASGRVELRLRQTPGPTNAMGTLKFMMPNELGIYLHDTPDKALFQAENRQFSAGCVRLERAADLAAWIRVDKPLNPAFLGAAQVEDQFSPVTVYVIYLTAGPAPGGVRFYPDVYGRDGARPAPPATMRLTDGRPLSGQAADRSVAVPAV